MGSRASDPSYLATPIHEVLRELYRIRGEYLKLVKEFVSLHKDEYSQEDLDQWNEMILDTMDKVTTVFTEEHDQILARNYQAHREMMYELSAPCYCFERNNRAALACGRNRSLAG